MESVVLVIHLFLALAIVGFVLLQRSEGGGLGIGGGGGGLGGFAGAQSTANFLTKATTICAVAFFCTSLLLGILARGHHQETGSILDKVEVPAAAGTTIEGTPSVTVEEQDDGSIPEVPSNQ